MSKKLLFLFAAIITSAMAWAQPSGWSYRLPVVITENSGTTLYNYQVRVVVNTQALISAGQMNASGNDIRFGKNCTGSTIYPHWVESGINTSSTVIWVKVDTLYASSSRTIYMYYGNASATGTSTLTVFSGPYSATDSVSGGTSGGVANSQRGFRFAPTEDILMTNMGKNEPNGSTRYVTLFNFSTQAIVQQLQVSGPVGSYSYGTITNPVWLTQGTQYLLILYQGASDGYYYGTSSQIGQHLTYYDMRYCNSCSQNTFPTSVLSNYHYGYPDMLYYTRKHASVDPSAVPGTPGGGMTVAATGSTTVCPGTAVSLNASASGGTMPYSYQWGPASTLSSTTASNPVATPTTTTTYSVTAIDAVGCTSSSTVAVNTYSLPAVSLGPDVSDCSGNTVTLNAGSWTSYSWSTGATTQNISVTTGGAYSVSITDANGCVNSDTISVTFNSTPTVNLGSSLSSCTGTPVTINAGAWNAYSWNTGATTQTISVLTAGTYSVTVTDNNGCTGTGSVSVSFNPNPVVNLGPDVAQCGAATLDAGNPGLSYSWSTGETTQMISAATSGSYVAVVTDANGCSGSDTVNVTANPLPAVNLGFDITQCGGTVILNAGNNGSSYLWSNAAATQLISVSSSGTYWAQVTDANGCVNSDTVNVTINMIPLVDLGPNVTVCGGPVTLNAGNPGSNYVWQDASTAQTYSASTSGTYYVSVTDPNTGCNNSDTITLTINALPTVGFTLSNNSVCVNWPSFMLTGGTPAGGSYSGPGVSGTMFNPSTAGAGTHTITYSYTDGNGCTASATQTITVNACTGVEEYNGSSVNIYPNPTTGAFTLMLSGFSGEVKLQVVSAEGQKIIDRNIEPAGSELSLDLSGYAKGIYFVVATSGSETVSRKLVIE